MKNSLYFGDNLQVLREHIADESVDLIYLDPPFNSDQNYNVLFVEQDGHFSGAQIRAFEDTWRWDMAAAEAYQTVVEAGGRVSLAMQAFRQALGDNNLLAYLSMMAPRLVELRRVLKPTGSIYLHCDPTAGHYLKMLMDAVLGPKNFLSEIVWKRTHAHGSSKRYAPLHDTILFYSRSEEYVWSELTVPHSAEYVEGHFICEDDDGRRFQPITLTGAGVRHGESGKPWHGINPTNVGRHWALPGNILLRLGIEGETVQDKLEALDAAKRIYWPKKKSGTPRLKWYADELGGMPFPTFGPTYLRSRHTPRKGWATQPRSRRLCSSESYEPAVAKAIPYSTRSVVVERQSPSRKNLPELDRNRHYSPGHRPYQASSA